MKNVCRMGNTGRETEVENIQYPLGCWQIHIQIRWRRYFRERTETVHTIEVVNYYYKTRTIRNPLKILLYIQATSDKPQATETKLIFGSFANDNTNNWKKTTVWANEPQSFSSLLQFFFSCPMSSQFEREKN